MSRTRRKKAKRSYTAEEHAVALEWLRNRLEGDLELLREKAAIVAKQREAGQLPKRAHLATSPDGILQIDFKWDRVHHKSKIIPVDQIRLSAQHETLVDVLEAATAKYWHIPGMPALSSNLKGRIRAWVCRYKLGAVSGETLYQSVEEDLQKCLRKLKRKRSSKEVEPDIARGLISQESLPKNQLRMLFNNCVNKTIERYVNRGVRVDSERIKLLKRGKHGRYLVSDIVEFVKRTGLYSNLLPYIFEQQQQPQTRRKGK